MRRTAIMSFVAIIFVSTVNPANAKWSCSGVLTSPQESGFQHFFSPPFSPGLTNQGGRVADGNFSKVVDDQKLAQLSTDAPRVAASRQLDDANAKVLAGWLNENASATIPSWFATAIGIFIPAAWVGLSADIAVQLITSSGDAGRQKLANVAGTVSSGGRVAVTERIAKSSDGNLKYLWNFVYQARLNDKDLNFLLYSCSADVVVK